MSAADGCVPDVLVEDLVRLDPSRERRKARVRAHTISMARYSKRTLALGTAEYPPSINAAYARPQTREDCLPGGCNEARPCAFVRCKFHLYLDVNERTGSIKMNFPDREVWELEETCALDVADRGGVTLEELGEMLNWSRERARQVETACIDTIRSEAPQLADFIEVER